MTDDELDAIKYTPRFLADIDQIQVRTDPRLLRAEIEGATLESVRQICITHQIAARIWSKRRTYVGMIDHTGYWRLPEVDFQECVPFGSRSKPSSQG